MLSHGPNRSTGSVPDAISASDAQCARPWAQASTSSQIARTSHPPDTDASYEAALGYILTDCFISLGQGVKNEKTIEQAAVIWLHDRYRAKFLRTMKLFGNTWLRDRIRVKGVSRMLGERAVFYAGDKPSIDLASILQASAAVEKYCRLHAARRFRSVDPTGASQPTRHAGYWCEPGPE